MVIRRLGTVAAICLFGTSANAALTMAECRAQYKAKHAAKAVTLAWSDYQAKRCGIDPKANAPTPKPSAPVKH
jgi:hypothetical protein